MWVVALVFVLFSCGRQEGSQGLRLYSCPSVREASEFFQSKLRTEVLVSDVRARGSLCSYRLLLGKDRRPVQAYFSEGVYLVGIGIDAKTGKPYPEVGHENSSSSSP